MGYICQKNMNATAEVVPSFHDLGTDLFFMKKYRNSNSELGFFFLTFATNLINTHNPLFIWGLTSLTLTPYFCHATKNLK